MALVEEHGLLVLEDTCEALGSTFVSARNSNTVPKYLGTFGEFGTFSFTTLIT